MELVPIRCRIPELLHSIGKDQQWLADKTDKHKSQISEYSNLKEIMNLRTAALIADTIGCMIDDIYVWEWRQRK